jgi:hypothetical protein
VFKNTYKEQDKHPDYRILASKPQGEKPAEQKSDDFQDDIPF